VNEGVAKHPPRPLDKEKIDKIIELWKQGTNKTILACSFEVSRPRIARIIKNYELKSKKQKGKMALLHNQTK
jgi:DNA invertase Pin-like site-specific DNA recombinase